MDTQTIDRTNATLAKVLSETVTTQPALDHPSTQVIIDKMAEMTKSVEDFSIHRIDEMIERLQSLKIQIQARCKSNVEAVVELVRLVDDGLRDVDDLEKKVDKIEDNVATGSAAP
jgi:methyl-accepting chemotaxis protein